MTGIFSALGSLLGLLSRVADLWNRKRDRDAGRNEQKVADLEKTARILEGQRDVATRTPDNPDALAKRMRDGQL
jgi:hypothetical protein